MKGRIVAVLCGSHREFVKWANENPKQAGERIGYGAFRDATYVTGPHDVYRVRGLEIAGVIEYGTYHKMRDLERVRAYVRSCVRLPRTNQSPEATV